MKLPLKQIEAITTTEMTRQEFLKFIGAGMLGVVGVWGLVQNLQALQKKTIGSGEGRGYGSRFYGG